MSAIITVCNEVAKVMFLHLSVILFTGGCLPQCMLGYHPPGADTTPGSRPPRTRHPPRPGTPWTKHPPGTGRRLLLRMVRILLECILVFINIKIADRIGPSPILLIINTITIGTMLNNNSSNIGHGLQNVTCKQTFRPESTVPLL